MSCKNYIVTAQKATAVACSITGHFTGESDRNLLVAKHNVLELHLVCPEGLKALKEITIYGKIQVLLGFRPEGRDTGSDLIFILTSKKDAMILECQTEDERLRVVTLASGNVQERIGRVADNGPLGIADPLGRIAALRIYEGLLKIVPLGIANKQYDPDMGPDALKAFNVRIEDMDVIDIAFIDAANPTIAYICHDCNGRHLKTVEVNLESKDLMPGPWKMDSIEQQASMLIPMPLPYSGVVIVGQSSVTVRSKEGSLKTIAPPVLRTSSMLAFEALDASRFLLGDIAGRLFMLFIERDDAGDPGRIRDMKVELLGEISIPESISYLDNGVVYIGSRFGDSQLVKLLAEADDVNSYVQVMESFTNLAPIVDMAVVDTDRQSPGQGQLITCSGAHKDGSLRVVRSGVGINELANIDLEGLKGVWALRSEDSDFDNILLITFIGQTRTLKLASPPATGDGAAELEVEEVTLPGFEINQQTYHCQNVCCGQTLQVTPASARLIGQQQQLVAEWRPPSDRTISVCASNRRQLLVASGAQLVCIAIGNASLTEASSRQLEHEIACLDATPFDGEESELAAVGLWTDFSARLLTLPSLEEAWQEQLGVQVVPRSILMSRFDSGCHLFVALGDGSLLYYTQAEGRLCERKRVCLGTQPMTLRQLGPQSVFACSDRPAIAHCSNGKLVFSHVNLREVSHMCPMRSEAYANCVALGTATQLVFGTIDEIQKLHIRTVPLGESPKAIAHQPDTGTLAIITVRVDLRKEGSYVPARLTSVSLTTPHQSSVDGPSKVAAAGQGAPMEVEDEIEVYSFVLLDENTLEATHALHFPANPSCTEMALSLISMRLGSDKTPYYIVGVANIRPGETEPTTGRLVVLQYTEGSGVVKVSEKEVKGAPYAMCDFNHRLLVTVNSQVRLFEWNEGRELRLETSYYNNILALYLKTKGDFALVGDLMRSMTLLLYKPVETCLEEIARDHSPNWMFSIEIIDDDSFLGADNYGNLFVCARETDSSLGEEKLRLQETACFHLGDCVNVLRHGSLVMKQLGERLVPTSGSVLFGTVSGAIGLLCQLPEPLFLFLDELQRRLAGVIVGVGNIEHSKFREFDNEQKVEPAKDFVDGDLVESLLDLGRDRLHAVVNRNNNSLQRKTDFSSSVSESVPCTVDDLIKIAEELSRLH